MSSPSSSSTCSSTVSLTSMSYTSPCLVFGSGIGSMWVDFSFDSCIETSASRHSCVINGGWIRAPVHLLCVDFIIPLFMTFSTSVTPQNRGVSLITRQPAEYSWMSGNPTPLMKIGQSLLCTGSSTQGTKLVLTIYNDHTGSTCE